MLDMEVTLELLFQQLGLPSDESSIESFVQAHQLKKGEMMHLADFWTANQKEFLSSHWQKDDEWALVIDQLNELLSHHPNL